MGRPKKININEKILAIQSLARQISSVFGTQYGGDRDLYDVLGYPTSLTYRDYEDKYTRQDIAARIINAPASATWRTAPTILSDTQAFVDAYDALSKRLGLYRIFDRVDKLASLGRYGIVLLGVKGQADLAQPINFVRNPDDIIYLQPYGEGSAEIKDFILDTENAQYGMPEMYNVAMSDTASTLVHYSRVLHVAEGVLEDSVYGTPRLECVYNRLNDLEKVIGGGAETYWLNSRGGLVASVDPESEVDATDETAIDDYLEDYVNKLRRFIRVKGMNISALNYSVADPKGQFDIIISAISGATGIPQRILLGSERGELASSQDEGNWNSRISERQSTYAEPIIIRGFIDRLISIGALPKTNYTIEWPNLFELTETDKAAVAVSYSNAIESYAGLDSSLIVPPSEFRRVFLGLPDVPDDEDLSFLDEETVTP